MIGINNIGSYLPSNFELNVDKKDKFNIDNKFIFNKIGIEKVSRISPGEETSDLCMSAFWALNEKEPINLKTLDCLVVCTQNPDGNGIPHTSAIVHGKLDAGPHCASFDISLGCSGYVYALSVLSSFMESNGFESGLLFTADPYSKRIDPDDKNTALLFGDAATVTHLSKTKRHEKCWHPRSFMFATFGKDSDALNNRRGKIHMDGRAIFNFAMKQVPPQIKALLENDGYDARDIDLFLFHQGSRYMIDQLCRFLKLPPDKVPIKLADHGNTVSSSIPLMLEQYLGQNDLKRIVLSGFGVGLSLASCLVEHTNSEQKDRTQ